MTPPSTSVAEVLERARAHTQPLMREAVARLVPSMRSVVNYHLGWCDELGNPVEVAGGKGIRPALAVLSAEAAWADASVGAPGGAAVELVHNFSLVHDDLMDGDEERRHRPTVWALWGPSVAILAGDALATLATEWLLSLPNPCAPAAAAALGEATAEMIAGQADDLAFEKRRSVSVEECTAMSTAKTGALLGCAASIGAILAGAPLATVGALRDFGRHLGVAFQAVDDLLGIWGDPSTTGKPAGNDIRQRKKSMPIVAALASGGDEACELDRLLFGAPLDVVTPRDRQRAAHLAAVATPEGRTINGHVDTTTTADVPNDVGVLTDAPASPANSNANGWRPPETSSSMAGPVQPVGALRPLSNDEVDRATWLVEACGGREWTAARAKAHLDSALGALERARLSAVPRRALADLAVYVVERES